MNKVKITHCPNCGHDLRDLQVSNFNDDDDILYKDAVELAIKIGKVSPSVIQDNLNVGYARAVRLLSNMEENGILVPAEDGNPQKIFIKNKTL